MDSKINELAQLACETFRQTFIHLPKFQELTSREREAWVHVAAKLKEEIEKGIEKGIVAVEPHKKGKK